MGYKFQFVTLAGFHALNHSMFELARGYADRGMAAYVRAAGGRVRRRERTATPPRKHQREVGTGYFDQVTTAINPDVVDARRWPARPRRSSSPARTTEGGRGHRPPLEGRASLATLGGLRAAPGLAQPHLLQWH